MAAAQDVVLWDRDKGSLEGWRSNAADGSRASLAVETGPNGSVLRFDHALTGKGSWTIARCDLAFELPEHFVVTLRVRGETAAGEMQLKLVDPSGANVWWWRRRPPALPKDVEKVVLHRASLEFAWGPLSGADPSRVGAVEIAFAEGEGGPGTLWIEDLRVEPRKVYADHPKPERVRASSARAGHEANRTIEPDPETSWCAASDDACPWLEVDLGDVREWGGLVVDFSGVEKAPACRVLTSNDGNEWSSLLDDPGGASNARWLRTGEVESRYARIELPAATPAGVARVTVAPIELASSPVRWASARARAAPRGSYPRHLLREQAYWAVVGGDGDEQKGLLGEDGALEFCAESWTVEPFLWVDGRLLSWADVETTSSLVDGHLPIPSVEWTAADLRLRITTFAIGKPKESAIVARYEVESLGAAPRDVRLFLAIRPFQVNPGWQSLNIVGGVAPISRLERNGASVRVNGEHALMAVTRPDAFGAATAEEGLASLREGKVPARCEEGVHLSDPLGFAEGALAFDLRAAKPGAGETASVVIAVPLFDKAPPIPSGLAGAEAAAWGAARLDEASSFWRERLSVVPISLPPSGARFEASVRGSLAWILVNREGPRIQPGPRCYRRSWVRDGVLTGTALAEMGLVEEARAFLRWYSPYQLPDGRVPCAVDRHGVDLVAEHDSHGQLIWGIVEIYRLTRDRAFLEELWPHALRAVDAIANLRAERTDTAHRGKPSYGLVPESISHEGYSSQPVHSYWDDFFAVLGLSAAAHGAEVLGDARAAEIAKLRDDMRRDVHASIVASITEKKLDFIPGSVELGDFDPTSTAISFDPCEEASRLPRAALEHTFERYWAELDARRTGKVINDGYTPYEVRNGSALLGLGWKERAHELLDWLVGDQRPSTWCQWPEVSMHDRRVARFLGDLPHGWVASSFVRSVRRLIAWEDDEAGTLLVGGGVPEAWVREAPGVRARGLPTHFGALDLTIASDGEDRVRVTLGGNARPPGGVLVASPFARPLRGGTVNGKALPGVGSGPVLVREMPAEVVLSYR